MKMFLFDTDTSTLQYRTSAVCMWLAFAWLDWKWLTWSWRGCLQVGCGCFHGPWAFWRGRKRSGHGAGTASPAGWPEAGPGSRDRVGCSGTGSGCSNLDPCSLLVHLRNRTRPESQSVFFNISKSLDTLSILIFLFPCLPPSLSLLSAQDVSMATLQPGPLQPVWHSQCQLCWPMVHCPFPLQKLGQPSVKGKTWGQRRGGRWEGGETIREEQCNVCTSYSQICTLIRP